MAYLSLHDAHNVLIYNSTQIEVPYLYYRIFVMSVLKTWTSHLIVKELVYV